MTGDVLRIDIEDRVATVTMNRPDKRNAMNDELLAALGDFFAEPPANVKAVILTGTQGNFCSGLDLGEHSARTPEENLFHSRGWHEIMDRVHYGRVPVVSALFGAVVGGGLELAAATHVRIAEPSTIFQLPEGRRGIFVGGGATVRIGRILGADRMVEMMLTGRRYGAEEGLMLGLNHYAVGEGEALGKARELAERIAANAPLSNYVMIHGVSRIQDMAMADGLFTESLCAAITQTTPDAKEGLAAFLEKRAPNFR